MPSPTRAFATPAVKEHPILNSSRHIRPALAVAMLSLLVFAAPSYATLAAPTPTGPSSGTVADAPPVFTWSAVTGADHYAFQLGGSAGFNPPQFSTSTRDTRVALTTAIASGDYTWRVAAVNVSGVQGPWSAVRSLTEVWSDKPSPISPAATASLAYH